MSNTVNIYVNKTDLGLNNVDNTSDLNKPISTATQTALNGKENVSNKSTDVLLGTSDTLYPSQNAVKTYVDTAMSTPVIPTLDQVATAGSTTDVNLIVANDTFTGIHGAYEMGVQRQLEGKFASIFADGFLRLNTTGSNKVDIKGTNLHADIVLEAPNKTAGTYTIATATDLNDYVTTTDANTNYLATTLKGANNGVAELDGTGKVPSSQLPSYVDDVLEYANLAAFPVTGTTATIYLALDTNLTYRWGGTSYVEISPSLALGETSSSAYRGDRGKIAYDHSLLTSGNPHNVTKSDVGLSNVVNSDTTTTTNITDSLNKRFVTDAQLIILGNTSGTNTGDETATTIKSKLGITTLSGSNTGDQDLSGLVVKNVAITGATKTKITYDSKGLVTSGADATTADIADSTNKRYVTDAQLTVIGNTSGTNTGDQDLSGYATKNLTLDRKTASYTLVAGDNNKLIEMNVASANNVTINNSVFTAGNQILVSQYGAGQVTFVAGAGVTLRSPSGKLKLTGQYSLATIIAISATEFYISGDLTA
jgi:hypothetical protein